MKKILIIVIISVILIGLGFLTYWFWPRGDKAISVTTTPQKNFSTLKINNQELKVEVVDNEELRMKGLSGRNSLCADCGMLFVFEKADIYPFWMKEMRFALDIIWIKDKKIVDIVQNAQTPESAGKIMTYTPKTEADLVLEVNGGFVVKNGLKIGDEIQIKN